MSVSLNPAILDFYARLPQQGPGSDADAEAALRPILAHLPSPSVAADLGSGTGRSALFLAERLGARIIAVELESRFCERLAEDAEASGLSALVDIRQGDMNDPPIRPASLDLLWCENAAYLIGFAAALARWRPLLKARGFCILSECSWLKDERPQAVERYFAAGYPGMTTVAGNIARARAQGYELLATHVVSAGGWERYYDPIRRSLRAGEVDRADPAFASQLAEEISLYERSIGSYGYVFYVLRRTD